MKKTRIDVHHHILPPEFVSKLNELGVTKGLGVPLPEWSPEKSLTFMKKNGIRTAVTSIAVPDVVEDTTVLRDLTRWCNEYSAGLKREHPGAFGGLAALPLPDVEGALTELEYALDELNLDGVGLFAHYKGMYLGNTEFDSLFSELNKRKTVVFIHPIDPPEEYDPKLGMPSALIEAPFETTRAVANMMYTGTLDRYPNIHYVLSHGGGTIPYLAWRIALVRYIQEGKKAVMRALYDFYVRKGPQTGLNMLRTMYYDTALASSPYALRALQEFAGPSRIVFGTDYPFAAHLTPYVVKDLIKYGGFSEEDLVCIENENSLKLFPQLEM